MKQKTVKVTTDNQVSIIDVDFNDVKDIRKAINGDFETVRTQCLADFFCDSYIVMLVDSNGIMRGLPVNTLGCIFYETARHGCPIAGDLIFAQLRREDIGSPENPEKLKDKLLGVYPMLWEV